MTTRGLINLKTVFPEIGIAVMKNNMVVRPSYIFDGNFL